MEVYILEIVLIFIYLIIGAIFAIIEYDDQGVDKDDDKDIDQDDDKETNYSEANYYDQKQQSSVNTLGLIEIMFFWPVMIIAEVVKMVYAALKDEFDYKK